MTTMARILFIASMLMTCSCVAAASEMSSPSPSPGTSPSTDCGDIIYNLVECYDFLMKGSKYTKPRSECCDGFESMAKTNGQCICEAISSSSELGLAVNFTKAIILSSRCGISANPIATCDMTPSIKSPTPSPSSPKKSLPPPSPLKSPAPAPSGGGVSEAPAPAPAPAQSPRLKNGVGYINKASASITIFIISMLVVASFF